MSVGVDPGDALTLSPSEAHVWHVGLDMKSDEPSRSRASCHGSLRRVLGGYLGVEPGVLSFVCGRYGKPALACASLHFNVAYSRDVALVAVARREIGVDVERIVPERALGPIAERFFAPAEVELLHGLRVAERIRVFYRLWTRKEAYAKATGRGLSHPLRHLPVHPSLATHDAERWDLRDLEVDHDVVAALCVEGPVDRVRLFRLRPSAAP